MTAAPTDAVFSLRAGAGEVALHLESTADAAELVRILTGAGQLRVTVGGDVVSDGLFLPTMPCWELAGVPAGLTLPLGNLALSYASVRSMRGVTLTGSTVTVVRPGWYLVRCSGRTLAGGSSDYDKSLYVVHRRGGTVYEQLEFSAPVNNYNPPYLVSGPVSCQAGDALVPAFYNGSTAVLTPDDSTADWRWAGVMLSG